MTERFFEDIDPGTLFEKTQTERAMAEYAEAALQNSVVSVEVIDCQHSDLRLPQELAQTFEDLPKKPKSIEAVDLKLKYNPAASMFETLDARLRFDTKYALIFHRISSRLPGVEAPLYYGAVTNPLGKIVRKSDTSIPFEESEVSAILNSVGMDVPESPQPANWNEISTILHFAGLWTAQTVNTALIDPVRTVSITDRVEGSGLDNDRGRTRRRSVELQTTDEGIRKRTLTFAVDEASRATEPAEQTWKLIASSNSRYETPCINSLELTPLEFKDTMFEDYGFEVVLEEPFIRHELTDQTVRLPLDNLHLKAARYAIAEATHLL